MTPGKYYNRKKGANTRRVLWCLVVGPIGFISLLLTSCTKGQTTHEFGLSVAYPPYSCTRLEPTYVKIQIDGKMYVLDVEEVPGGFVTDKGLSFEYGRYTVESMIAYNKNGKETHFIAKEIGGLAVITTPFPIEVSERLPWVSGQMFCK